MLADLDLTRPHVFATRLHAVRGTLPRRMRQVSAQSQVRSRFGACIDKGVALVLEQWPSHGAATSGVFESSIEVRKAVALVAAVVVHFLDDDTVHTLAPWDSDDVEAMFVALPYRTTGTLRLRSEATPFDGRVAFRLVLCCDKWTSRFLVPAPGGAVKKAPDGPSDRETKKSYQKMDPAACRYGDRECRMHGFSSISSAAELLP
jgi:hypothetical protein